MSPQKWLNVTEELSPIRDHFGRCIDAWDDPELRTWLRQLLDLTNGVIIHAFKKALREE